MQLKRYAGCCLVMAALFGCQNEYETEQGPAAGGPEEHTPEATRPAVNAAEQAEVRIESAEAAQRLAERQGVRARFREASQQTADGEQVRVRAGASPLDRNSRRWILRCTRRARRCSLLRTWQLLLEGVGRGQRPLCGRSNSADCRVKSGDQDAALAAFLGVLA